MVEEFLVGCEFAHVWAKYAPPEHFQIYIYLTCCFSQKSVTLQPKEVATALGKSKRKVEAAFDFWQQVGLLDRNEEGDFYLTAKLQNCSDDANCSSNEADATKNIGETNSAASDAHCSRELTRQPYSPVEISGAMSKNRKVCELFKTCEMLLGKPLSQAHTQLVYSIYDWMGLEIEAIFVLFTYAAEHGKGTARWLEKTAMDWADKNIKTRQAAEEHVKYLEKIAKADSQQQSSFAVTKKAVKRTAVPTKCKFNNFSGKHDYDYDYIEKKAVNDMLGEQ